MTGIEQAAAAAAAARALLAGAPSFASMTDREVVAVLGHAAELSRTLTALQVRLAGELGERSRGPADQALCRTMGHRHARAAVAAVLGIRGSAAQALLRMAALTTPQLSLAGGDLAAKYPRVAAAFDAAEISLAQAQAIVDHLEPASPRADLAMLAWAEGALVDAATDPDAPLGPELLVTQARAYVAVLDPDGVLPSAERQRAMRSLKLWQQEDGMWQLRMICPPEAAAAIKALLDAYLSPRVRVAFRDDGEPGCDVDGEPRCDVDGAEVPHAGDGDPLEEEAPLDDRTPEQKRHDVLVGLVQAHAASGDAPVAAGEPPVLVLTGTIQAFDDYLHDRPSTDRTLTIEHTGDLVPIETMGRFLCHAALQRAVVDAEGHVLDLGRAERLFTRAQRRALAVRDRGCRVPGCGIPAAWCEAHHVVWWEHGGPTDVDNGILLCNYHHHEVHAGRLLVEADGTGPGHWRVRAQLRPADRSARATRSGEPTLAAMRAAADSSAAPAARRGPGVQTAHPRSSSAADGPRGLAIRVPQSAGVDLTRHPELAPHRADLLVRPPRHRSSIEARLRRVVRRSGPGARRATLLDLRPRVRVVLRT